MERGVYVLLRIRLRKILHRSVDHTYLRCVGEYQSHLVSVLNEIADHRCGTCNGGLLLRKGKAQILMSERMTIRFLLMLYLLLILLFIESCDIDEMQLG